MTDSAMLKTAAIGKLMDIQELCNNTIAAYEDPMYYSGDDESDLARVILGIIKAT